MTRCLDLSGCETVRNGEMGWGGGVGGVGGWGAVFPPVQLSFKMFCPSSVSRT